MGPWGVYMTIVYRCFLRVLVVAASWAPLARAQSSPLRAPPSGSVLLAGGGLDSAVMADLGKRLIALAGGPEAAIVVIPTADPNVPPRLRSRGQPSDPAELRRYFEALGARHVTVLHTRNRRTANSPTFTQVLRSANGVFLSGGQSLVLEHTYRGTLVERELHQLLARGGVVGGSSAGAIVIGCVWLTWLPDRFGKRSDEFCLLPGVAVSPHANVARGYVVDDEVRAYLAGHPGTVGIDIDENTVLELRAGMAEVFGHGTARFVHPTKDPQAPFVRLAPGERRSLTP